MAPSINSCRLGLPRGWGAGVSGGRRPALRSGALAFPPPRARGRRPLPGPSRRLCGRQGGRGRSAGAGATRARRPGAASSPRAESQGREWGRHAGGTRSPVRAEPVGNEKSFPRGGRQRSLKHHGRTRRQPGGADQGTRRRESPRCSQLARWPWRARSLLWMSLSPFVGRG